jgi:hypothetical protein
MKNKLLLIVLLAFAVLQACVKDEEKVFDDSAAERTNEAVNNLRGILVAESNGWLVEYYPEIDRSRGGYNFIWKFDANGTVVVAGEQATANYLTGDTLRSYFEVIANRGVVLTFDTYNEVFHYFSEPHNTNDVDGYAGDYEFVLREMTPQQIVMTGKKRGNRLLLTPYAGGDASTWRPYLEQFNVLHKKMTAADYIVNVNDTAATGFDIVTRKYRAFSFTYKNQDDNKTVPYILTSTGIKLYEPLTVDGETAQYFTFNETEGKLISEGPDRITIELGSPPPPLNVWFATMNAYGYLRTGSSSVMALVNTCNTNVYNGYGEELYYITVGNSYIASYPGRGLMFGSYSPTDDRVWDVQFFYTFTPTGDDLAIAYSGAGLNASYYSTYFAPLLSGITNKSPYSITANDPVFPEEVTLTSVSDPDFYFVVKEFTLL